jgi:hypothetical protein
MAKNPMPEGCRVKKYDENYYRFFEAFNDRKYYECHELLEEIWMTDRENKFLQGLLQMAVAVYHFETGNIRGARTLFTSAFHYLEPYRPKYWDVNLEPVMKYIQDCLGVLPETRDRVPLEELDRIPFPYIKLHLEPEAVE